MTFYPVPTLNSGQRPQLKCVTEHSSGVVYCRPESGQTPHRFLSSPAGLVPAGVLTSSLPQFLNSSTPRFLDSSIPPPCRYLSARGSIPHPAGGSHNSILRPSGSRIQPNFPKSVSCISPTIWTPSLWRVLSNSSRFSTW